ncbi:MAG: dihydroorotate dehydrogenase, partial [Alphaproteobacteria bacterium]|nr:dihydroorotate dehydrogenase [Alphaproteobacteria bacterium]
GNPKPRLFRLPEDQAVINRMGFNNQGQEAAKARLAGRGPGIVGINIGANKESAASGAAIADYAAGVQAMAPVADYLTINISSPNTPGLRALQDRGALEGLIAAVKDARTGLATPVFLKIAPDLEPRDVDDIARAAIDGGLDALIVSNTTVARPPLRSRHGGEAGGLSGEPLKALALQRLRDFRSATGGAIPLIAAGGIASGEDAYARIRAGASLVQLYTALVYEGPGVARRMLADLRGLAVRDGISSLSEAIGADSA